MTDTKQEPKKIKINPVEFSMLCDYASVSMDRKLSLNGIFERFVFKKMPAVHPQLFVVSKVLIPQGDHKLTFSLMQQDKVLASASMERNVEQKLIAHNHFWAVRNLKIESLDPVEMQILLDGRQIFVKRIPVIKLQAPQKD